MKQDFPCQAGSVRWLIHNTIIHPICGWLWFVGLCRASDWLHEWKMGGA